MRERIEEERGVQKLQYLVSALTCKRERKLRRYEKRYQEREREREKHRDTDLVGSACHMW